ncbi:MAG: helical backbone metal receptor [Acidimicrobiales bacterium]
MKMTRLFALLVAFALALAACGSDDASEESDATADEPIESTAADDTSDEDASDEEASDEEPSDEESSDSDDAMADDFPVTIESDGGTWTLEAAPQRVVSLSPTATEILFAIGAGDQVIAADAFSNYPAEAPTTDLSGFDPNVEAVVGYEPDLVVIANDANELVASLTELDIPVLVSAAPADLEQGYDEMAALGLATGHVDETAEAVASLRSEMEAAFATTPEVSARIYHELDETFFSASSNSFIGAVYAEMGAENIADEADTDGGGFPQLTEEYIVEADPQVIVITDQVNYTADDVAARPGWEQIAAVDAGNVVVVEADIASRWGPRLPQFVSAVADALTAVEPATADS